MSTRSKLLLALAGLAVAATPAGAAPVSPATDRPARALLLVPLSLTKLEDLSFGTVIPSAITGTVAINPATGARTFAGGVTGAPGDIGHRAEFAGAGSPGQQVIIWVVPTLALTSPAGDTITVLSMSIEGSPLRTIPATRAFYFGVGAVITIGANQPEGVYTSTFDVYANYF